MTDDTGAEKQKRKVGRSPSYPFLSVAKAIDQARALHAQEGEYQTPLPAALKAWGYGPKSSGGRQTLATLRYYGLIDVSGDGDTRKVKVSELARRIILDRREDETEKNELIRRVALMPVAHKTLYKEYPNGLGSDASVEHFLVFDKEYNPAAAKELIAEFKETASYIGLYKPRSELDNSAASSDNAEDETPPAIKVGDKVQVTVGGVDLFDGGTTVLGFSESGEYVFVDGSDSGAKLEEVTLIEAVAEAPALERPAVPAHLLKPKDGTPLNDVPPKGSRKAVFPLDEGDVSLIFPEGLSAEALAELGAYLDIFLKKEQRKAS